MTGFRNAYDKDPHDKSMRLDSHVDVVRLMTDGRTDQQIKSSAKGWRKKREPLWLPLAACQFFKRNMYLQRIMINEEK